jgi:hypothetical protein
LNSLEASAIEPDKLYMSVTYEHHEINDLVSGSDDVKDETERARESRTTLLQADYGWSQNWSATTMLTYVNHRRQVGISQGSFVDTTGLGDALLLIKYTPLRINLFSSWEYALGFGAKIPIGEDDSRNNSVPVSEDLQPSSGSYSGLGWGYVAYAFDQAARSQVFLSANTSINGENSRDYQFGNEFNLTLGTSYYFFESDWAISAQMRYRLSASDERAGVDIPNTGGKWLDFLPAVQYRLNDYSGIKLSARIPIYRSLDGVLQFTTSNAFSLTYSYAF